VHARPISRRRLFGAASGAGAAALFAACADGDATERSPAASTAARESADGSLTESGASEGDAASSQARVSAPCDDEVPEETAGPFPGDGSNGPNVLAEPGVVRSDIRASVGSASGTADGAALTIRFELIDAANGCAPLRGGAVYVWHCTRDGQYSMYDGLQGENYLRGVQVAGDDGVVQFVTVFPGCYSGRWPHAHFQVYASQEAATSATSPLVTSQLAFPEDACRQVYAAADGYRASADQLQQLSIGSDSVFGDGADHQVANVTGDVAGGLVATLAVTV
jgi:protocatechuate 3,4-dioxygenase beta subunit